MADRARRQLLYALRCLRVYETSPHISAELPLPLRAAAARGVTSGEEVEGDQEVVEVGIIDLAQDDDEAFDVESYVEGTIALAGGVARPSVPAIKPEPAS